MKTTFLFLMLISQFIMADSILKLAGLDLVTGKKIELNTVQTDKKGTVVVFLSAKCPCSNSHMSILNELPKQYPEFQFIGVHSNPEENLSDSKKYFTNAKLPFAIIQDDHTFIADQLKALKTPHSYILSQKGEIVYQGGVTNSANAPHADRQFLSEALDDIKKGNEVRTKMGRTLGCAIIRESEKNVW